MEGSRNPRSIILFSWRHKSSSYTDFTARRNPLRRPLLVNRVVINFMVRTPYHLKVNSTIRSINQAPRCFQGSRESYRNLLGYNSGWRFYCILQNQPWNRQTANVTIVRLTRPKYISYRIYMYIYVCVLNVLQCKTTRSLFVSLPPSPASSLSNKTHTPAIQKTTTLV